VSTTDAAQDERANDAPPVVVAYRDAYRADFDRLNRAWIEQHFALEGEDEALLRDPYATIVAPGGEVLFVVVAGAVVGTCALKPEGPPAARVTSCARWRSIRRRGGTGTPTC